MLYSLIPYLPVNRKNTVYLWQTHFPSWWLVGMVTQIQHRQHFARWNTVPKVQPLKLHNLQTSFSGAWKNAWCSVTPDLAVGLFSTKTSSPGSRSLPCRLSADPLSLLHSGSFFELVAFSYFQWRSNLPTDNTTGPDSSGHHKQMATAPFNKTNTIRYKLMKHADPLPYHCVPFKCLCSPRSGQFSAQLSAHNLPVIEEFPVSPQLLVLWLYPSHLPFCWNAFLTSVPLAMMKYLPFHTNGNGPTSGKTVMQWRKMNACSPACYTN